MKVRVEGLTKRYKSIDDIAKASFEELSMIEDVGSITAESIYEFFRQGQTIDLIKRLKERFQDSQDNGVDFSLKELKESEMLKRKELRDRLLKMNEKQILVEIAMMLYKEK